MKLKFRKEKVLDDWYVIERAEHDGAVWIERTGIASFALRDNARISDATIEGTSEQMLEIARAIIENESCTFKRCAVTKVKDGSVGFYSPRNSAWQAKVPLEDAIDLANQIVAELGR